MYESLYKTDQWSALKGFFCETGVYVRSLASRAGGYDEEEPSQWERIVGGLARSQIDSAEKSYQAIVAVRVRAAGEIDPWRYAKEFVRLTPPIITDSDPAS